MTKKLFNLARVLSAVIISCTIASQASAGNEQNALEMLRETGVTKNFPMMCLQTAVMTQTFAIMANSIGKEKAMQILIEETKAVTPKYQEQWDKNMALAWAPHLSDEEMQSIKELKQKAPFANKFVSLQDTVGPKIQSASKDLLISTVGEIISNAFKKATP